MSKSFLRILPLAAATLGASSATVFGAVQRTENFDSEPTNWVGLNNRPPAGGTSNDFGFSNTDNTTSTDPAFATVTRPATGAGEAGGTVDRGGTNMTRAFYADSTVGPLTFRDPLSFSGRIVHPGGDSNFYLGFFNSETGAPLSGGNTGFLANHLGFQVNLTGSGPQFQARAADKDGTRYVDSIVNSTLPGRGEGIVSEFSFTFTPGADGPDAGTYPDTYVIAAEVNGQTFNSGPLTGGADNFTLDFDRFGLHNYEAASSRVATVFIDDLSYTAIPEPASLGLVGAAGLMMLRRRRQSA